MLEDTRFEFIVLDVLHKLGYGSHRDDLQRVAGTGDGGIDGIISLDKLGLERTYVKAKRWQGPVGRPCRAKSQTWNLYYYLWLYGSCD